MNAMIMHYKRLECLLFEFSAALVRRRALAGSRSDCRSSEKNSEIIEEHRRRAKPPNESAEFVAQYT
jgi:hypothetical protein